MPTHVDECHELGVEGRVQPRNVVPLSLVGDDVKHLQVTHMATMYTTDTMSPRGTAQQASVWCAGQPRGTR